MKNYYIDENNKILSSYEDTLKIIKEIYKETKECDIDKNIEYYKLLNRISEFIILIGSVEKNINDTYFKTKSITELDEQNYMLYNEFLPRNYSTSYLNPSYAVEVFGDEMGQLFSLLYSKYKNYITLAYTHKLVVMEKYNQLFINVSNYIKNNNNVIYTEIKGLITDFEIKNIDEGYEYFLKENYDKDFSFYTDIVMNSDLDDLRYLYKYGEYVTENEIKTAEFLLSYSSEKLNELSESIVKAYIEGFIRENKDITKRNNVQIICNIGQEKVVRQLIKEFKKHNLEGYVTEINTTDLNKQYDYDHKFDNAIYLNNQYVELSIEAFMKEAKSYNKLLKDYSGVLLIEKFGEEPFSPESKEDRLKLSDDQQQLYQTLRNQMRKVIEEFMPNTETSFCIVAFPTPEIGENFEEIFNDIIKVNMLDNSKYEIIQQVLIDALDKGEYVHVKGKDENKTDIKVKLSRLKNPKAETNFVNCVADVNIPLGEVFTTPVLKSTNGILHIEETYLEDFNYKNLTLTFKDGYVSDYLCSNFEQDEDNKNYIRENLLFPYKTLPIGEFAIGTNTLAYVIAEKYQILDKLPVLIIEKMGPHFAIGDTCFSWAEDIPMYNMLDKKEIVARDNEKSILRKTNLSEAYTNRHIDITLPYKSLGYINVITENGDIIEIIKDGRFILKGTEDLNMPFDN